MDKKGLKFERMIEVGIGPLSRTSQLLNIHNHTFASCIVFFLHLAKQLRE